MFTADVEAAQWHLILGGLGKSIKVLRENVKSWGKMGDFHVVTDFRDQDDVFSHDCAIVLKTSTVRAFEPRYGLYISLPLPPHHTFPAKVRASTAEKPVLVFWQGNLNTRPDLRRNIAAHDNGDDIKICASSNHIHQCGYDYRTEMQQCKFGLAPGGVASHSFRLLEILSAGAVPVVFGDIILPFSSLIDWSRCSVRLRLDQVEEVPQILRSYQKEQWLDMQHHAVQAYETYLSSEKIIAETALRILRHDMELCTAAADREL